MTTHMTQLLLSSVICHLVTMVLGHGNMVEPPTRATMHDHGFPDNPADDNWMEGFCGGKAHQWGPDIGGKCGICGDPWDASVRQHEAPGGQYANGVIVRNYQPGQIIPIVSHITANHVGFVEVRLCPNDNIDQDPDQDCFDKDDAVLTFVETGDTKFWVTDAMGTGEMTGHVQLPMWECDQCIMQWTYRNGRDWGTCNGACGPVETFRGCADISIKSGNNTAETTTSNNNNEEVTEEVSSTTNVENETTSEVVQTTVEVNDTTSVIGDTCRATGAWEGNPTTDQWCQENCHYDPPYCPPDVCTCDSASVVAMAHGNTECVATGLWSGDQVMSQWCQVNCLNVPSFCPQDICHCS